MYGGLMRWSEQAAGANLLCVSCWCEQLNVAECYSVVEVGRSLEQFKFYYPVVMQGWFWNTALKTLINSFSEHIT